ncbi:MAG TPA: hypothetical protein VGP04_08830 [Pseudonocardiaceae bacterium]|nr:hypothetical protein [Pseudonocardiaceae bacterium]
MTILICAALAASTPVMHLRTVTVRGRLELTGSFPVQVMNW